MPRMNDNKKNTALRESDVACIINQRRVPMSNSIRIKIFIYER